MCGLRSESRREVSGKNRAVGREIWQGPSQPPRRAYARVGGIGARGGQAPVCQPDITVLRKLWARKNNLWDNWFIGRGKKKQPQGRDCRERRLVCA